MFGINSYSRRCHVGINRGVFGKNSKSCRCDVGINRGVFGKNRVWGCLYRDCLYRGLFIPELFMVTTVYKAVFKGCF